MFAMQKGWNPEQVKPPDGIGEELGRCECPGLAKRPQLLPRYFPQGLGGIAINIGQFAWGEPRMLFWAAINHQPRQQPAGAEKAGKQKCPSPAQVNVNPGDSKRRQDRSHVGAGVEQAGGESTLLAGKPFGNRLDAGGKVARFSQAEHKTRGNESPNGVGQRVPY